MAGEPRRGHFLRRRWRPTMPARRPVMSWPGRVRVPSTRWTSPTWRGFSSSVSRRHPRPRLLPSAPRRELRGGSPSGHGSDSPNQPRTRPPYPGIRERSWDDLSIPGGLVRRNSEGHSTQEEPMGAKGEALAKELEGKVKEATSLLETLNDTDWRKTTAGEKWTVGVAAHHIAGSYEPITNIIQAIAGGHPLPHFTQHMLDEMNAKHSAEFSGCTRPETIALLKKGAAAAATAVRGLSDEQLAKTGTVFAGMPPMSAEDMVKRALLGHIDEHFGSIRKTVGR